MSDDERGVFGDSDPLDSVDGMGPLEEPAQGVDLILGNEQFLFGRSTPIKEEHVHLRRRGR